MARTKPKLPELHSRDTKAIDEILSNDKVTAPDRQATSRKSTTNPKPSSIAPERMQFTATDMRAYIDKNGQLASALSDYILTLDPLTRQHAKPSTVLKSFFAANDKELAKLFVKMTETGI